MKVCILAAGGGTRSRAHAMNMHKALLPLGNVAVLSRIIGQFPIDAELVVAVGHYAQQITDYLAIAHPGRIVTLVVVDHIVGPRSGPGYSLLSCQAHLQEPFIFTACDTLIPDPVPAPTENWIGVQPVNDPERWCTASTDARGRVSHLHYKQPGTPPLAFIGIAGVKDHEVFWPALTRGLDQNGESQVIAGLEALIPAGLNGVALPWRDVGDKTGYDAALSHYEANYSFEGKTTDVTYRLRGEQHGDVVVKFFADPEVSRRRFLRGTFHRDTFAEVIELRGNFFSYRFVPGRLLADVLDPGIMIDFLEWLEAHFWRPLPADDRRFTRVCRDFYRDKTLDRLARYLSLFSDNTEPERFVANGVDCPTVAALVESLPETFWAAGLASTFHGDLHADNVIVRSPGSFGLIDWRQDFAGDLDLGDRYYDLAKFMHTLDFGVEAMAAGAFCSSGVPEACKLEHNPVPHAAALQEAFKIFCARHGYDLRRIELLHGLIFINMAPLYDKALAEYLYRLGRFRLATALTYGGIA